MSDLLANQTESAEEVEEVEESETEVSDQYESLKALDSSILIANLLNTMQVDNETAEASLAIVQNRIKAELPKVRKALKDAETKHPKNDAVNAARVAFDKAAKALAEYGALKTLLEEREADLSDKRKAVENVAGMRTTLDVMLPNIRKMRNDASFGDFMRARKGTKAESEATEDSETATE